MQVSCNKVVEMRYGPHVTSNDRARAHDPPSSPVNVPSAPSNVARRAPKRRIRHPTFDLPLQAAAAERVGHNDAQCTSYGMGFLLCKTGMRGGGGSTWIYDGDGDA
jgi:hypothetical protein